MARITAYITIPDDQLEGVTQGELEESLRARLDEVFVDGSPAYPHLVGIDIEDD